LELTVLSPFWTLTLWILRIHRKMGFPVLFVIFEK
jgi:hypothetical protein